MTVQYPTIPAERGTDSAALATVATETRLAELDAANLPTDIGAIPTTAMRGTDAAMLAASYTAERGTDSALTAHQFSLYTYGPTALANGAYYVPAANTIVHTALLDGATVDALSEFFVADLETLEHIVDAFLIAENADKVGMARVITCDGTNMRFGNFTGAQMNLKLQGVSFT